MDNVVAESRWYLMLFPDEAETEVLVARLRALATVAAGVVTTTPHVTIGYFGGTAAPEAVLRQLDLLDEPAFRFRPPSYSVGWRTPTRNSAIPCRSMSRAAMRYSAGSVRRAPPSPRSHCARTSVGRRRSRTCTSLVSSPHPPPRPSRAWPTGSFRSPSSRLALWSRNKSGPDS